MEIEAMSYREISNIPIGSVMSLGARRGAMPKSEPGAPPGRLVTAPTTPSWRFAWGLAVTACFVAAYSGGALTAFTLAARAKPPVMAEVVADQQKVKPWFMGRLPFAPQVFDLTQAGFTLASGRADVLAGQPSATLVYRHSKHLISLLSQPVGSTARKSHEGTDDSGFAVRD
jgi:anti-sigma factor RsiW